MILSLATSMAKAVEDIWRKRGSLSSSLYLFLAYPLFLFNSFFTVMGMPKAVKGIRHSLSPAFSYNFFFSLTPFLSLSFLLLRWSPRCASPWQREWPRRWRAFGG